MPDLIGFGKYLYPLATGLKKILSNPWLKAKIPLFIVSKQSFTSDILIFFYFFLFLKYHPNQQKHLMLKH